MLLLTLDGHPVTLPAGTSFRVTRENPLYSSSGDYTLSLTLPLDGCPQNRAALGCALDRPEVPAAPWTDRRLAFRLVAPPLTLEGTALVTGITETAARLQLVAGASAVTLEGEDRYIDEMDLGEAYDTFPHDISLPDGTVEPDDPRARLLAWLDHNTLGVDLLHGQPSETPCVCWPVWSEADEAPANAQGIRHSIVGDTVDTYGLSFVTEENTPASVAEKVSFAAQPYLMDIVRRVVRALGYEVRRDDVAGTWMDSIFIANARCEYKLRRILPHWTVREFLDEVRRFFGVCFTAGDGWVDIIRRHNYYSTDATTAPAATICLMHVLTQREVTLDDDATAQDTTTGNVDYDHDTEDPMLRLPDDVWENAETHTFPNLSALTAWTAAHIPAEERARSRWLLATEDDGKVYAYLRDTAGVYGLAQVDCFPPLIRGGHQFTPTGRDIDIRLRIVPARMAMQGVDFGVSEITSVWASRWSYYPDRALIPMLVTSGTRQTGADQYSVDAALNPPDDTDTAASSEPPAVIEVALNNGATWQASFSGPDGERLTPSIPQPFGIAYVRHYNAAHELEPYYMPIVSAGNRDQLRLTANGPGTIRHDALQAPAAIDTRCQHLVRFTDSVPVDPTAIYLIRGRRFVCQKIEVTVTPSGLDPLKTAYLYELTP